MPDCVAWVVINISRCKQLEAELQRLATIDELTGLLNRRAFLAAAESAMAAARAPGAVTPLAVAVFDLDHFKAVNDGFGHAVGDAVLQHIAARLEECPVAGRVLGRIGGEEFAVLFPCTGLNEAVESLQATLAACASRPFHLAQRVVPMAFSAGVVVMGEEDTQPSDLLRRADHWMYEAKNGGRGRVAYPGWIERRQR